MGALARQFSLELIPVCLLAVYAGLLAAYMLAIQPQPIPAYHQEMDA